MVFPSAANFGKRVSLSGDTLLSFMIRSFYTEGGEGMIASKIRGEIGLIILARPWANNRLNGFMVKELSKQLAGWAETKEVKMILLASEGDTFCTGFEWNGEEGEEVRKDSLAEELEEMLNGLYNHPKLTVAVINGKTKDVGLEVAAACDFRLACAEAMISFEPLAPSLAPFISYRYLFKRMPSRKVLELLGTGAQISGTEGYQTGFVNKLLPASQWLEAALQWCEPFVRQPLETLQLYKQEALKSDLTR